MSKIKSRHRASGKSTKIQRIDIGVQPPRAKAEAIAKAAIEATVVRHAEDARVRKERDERLRLGPRQLVTGHLVLGILKAIELRSSNGLHLTEERIGKVATEHAKQVLRELGLEVDGKKEKEHKSD